MPNPNKEMPTFKHFFLDAEPQPGKQVFKSVLSVCKICNTQISFDDAKNDSFLLMNQANQVFINFFIPRYTLLPTYGT